MTPIEIAALVEQGIELIIKVAELIKSAQRGELTPAEAKRLLADQTDAFNRAVDDARDYLDAAFDKDEP